MPQCSKTKTLRCGNQMNPLPKRKWLNLFSTLLNNINHANSKVGFVEHYTNTAFNNPIIKTSLKNSNHFKTNQ